MFDNELVMTNRGPASDLMALLDVQLHECAPTRVSGSIAADQRHHQPWGIVHGGLYTTAIETFATVGARATVKDRGQQAVGVANATDFLPRIEAGASRSSPSGRGPSHGTIRSRPPPSRRAGFSTIEINVNCSSHGGVSEGSGGKPLVVVARGVAHCQYA